MPGLNWKSVNAYHTTNIGQTRLQTTDISTHCVDVDTISYAGGVKYGNWCGTTLNTDSITLQSNIKPVVCPTTHNNEYKIQNIISYLIKSYLYVIPSTYSQQEPKVRWPKPSKPLRTLT